MVKNGLSIELPPWALPKEEITLYIKIKKNIKFSKIIISIPKYFEIKDTINVIEYKISRNTIQVEKIGKLKQTKIDYFGIIISTKEPFNDLAVQCEIKVKLIDYVGKESEYTSFARIFRPRLRIIQIPDEIPLHDNQDASIPVHLKFMGFGDIALRIEATIGGKLVSEGGSLMDKVFHEFLKAGILEKEFKRNDLGIKIDEITLARMVDDFKTKLKDKDFLEEMKKDKTITRQVINFLSGFNKSEQEKYMKIFYGTMEGFLISKLTELLTRSVSSNLNLDSGTKISTQLSTTITNLKLKIFYKDLAGNIYAPLEKQLKIIDKRKTSHQIPIVTLPIEIEKVDESEAFRNVGKMVIGSIGSMPKLIQNRWIFQTRIKPISIIFFITISINSWFNMYKIF